MDIKSIIGKKIKGVTNKIASKLPKGKKPLIPDMYGDELMECCMCGNLPCDPMNGRFVLGTHVFCIHCVASNHFEQMTDEQFRKMGFTKAEFDREMERVKQNNINSSGHFMYW